MERDDLYREARITLADAYNKINSLIAYEESNPDTPVGVTTGHLRAVKGHIAGAEHDLDRAHKSIE
jgi:hypothetical protein